MKEFKEPVVNVILLSADIITTSAGNPIETSQSGNLLASTSPGPNIDE